MVNYCFVVDKASKEWDVNGVVSLGHSLYISYDVNIISNFDHSTALKCFQK